MGVRFLLSTLRPSVLLTLNGSFDGLVIVHLTSERQGGGSRQTTPGNYLNTTCPGQNKGRFCQELLEINLLSGFAFWQKKM